MHQISGVSFAMLCLVCDNVNESRCYNQILYLLLLILPALSQEGSLTAISVNVAGLTSPSWLPSVLGPQQGITFGISC